MIVPMNHITVLCLESEKRQTLAALAKLGVMHVITTVTDTESMLTSRASIEEARRALTVITVAGSGEWHNLSFKPLATAVAPSDTLVSQVNQLADRYMSISDELRTISQEIEQYHVWGDFSLEDIDKLAAAGISVTLFKAKLTDEMPTLSEGIIEVFGQDKQDAFGAVINAPLPEGLLPVSLPKVRLGDLTEKRNVILGELESIAAKLAEFQDRLPEIQATLDNREEHSEYMTAFENMPTTGIVSHIEGFVDARRAERVTAAAKEHGWGLSLREPQDDELPPTLLEPPRIFRPITALFTALGITPGYRETDVSVPFFIFFSIFFAMLIGDAGYGAMILALTLFGHKKARAKGAMPEMVRSLLTLFYVFSGCTIAYGVLSGTYFGIDKAALPACLQFKSIAFLNDMDNIMQLCFTLGAAHLSLARIWNAAALFPSKKMLAEIGWVGVIASMYMIICSIVIAGFTFPAWGTYLMIVSILLIVFFMLDRSELKTEGASLGMLPLNIASSMGDIISYVRLFAVGLASVKVAENFNMMAMDLDLPMAAKIPIMIFILVLGHGLNFMMGALSILVHAVRLNTLEFSGAKGVTWAGQPFKAFKATAKDEVKTAETL